MELTLNEIISATKGKILYEKEGLEFNNVCIDTRKIKNNNIYIAIKGENFDGNDYVEKAFENGASMAIVSSIKTPIEEMTYKGTIILVDDTRKALGDLAGYYRDKLGLKVVGITGSVGKTSTKDIVAAFLSGKYNVFKTKGNFNNDIGLPLMILELDYSYDVAVLEMGMSNLHEIEYLANIAKPDIGIITNIGISHIENLKTKDNILKAKMEITSLFNKENTLILNGEDELLKKISSNCYEVVKIGYNYEYEINGDNIILGERETTFDVNVQDKKYNFTINMPGKHNVLNSLLAVATSIKLGLDFDEMKKGLNSFEATSMRLEITEQNGIKIINDCYNASPSSMKAAIDVLNNYKKERKVAILGTMLELGDKAYESHKDIGEYLRDRCDLLIAIGEFSKAYKEGFNNENIITFENRDLAIREIKNILSKNDVVLIKASRGAKFEEIVTLLQK